MAAVLACGDDALLSHVSAAAMWGLTRPRGGDIDVTLVGRTVHRRQGIAVHRARSLRRDERAARQGIPVTSPARTLLDLATTLPARDLGRAAEEAQVQRLLTPHQLHSYLARSSNRRGVRALRAATRHDPAFTRSEAERRLLELIRAAELPEPQANVRIRDHEVDFLWRRHGLVVEVDGYAYHSTRAAFERDRRRDADLEAAGMRVHRVTWRQISHEPEALVARLAVALAPAATVALAPAATVALAPAAPVALAPAARAA
jgi:very-short-patch-repair endonuclease